MSKNNDFYKIRINEGLKRHFFATCKSRRIQASKEIRMFIEDYVKVHGKDVEYVRDADQKMVQGELFAKEKY